MPLTTLFTKAFDIDHPVVLAPMDLASGGRLAAAVTNAGGFGLIGGGYGNREWVRREFARSEGANVGCGFITWSLALDPGILDAALEHRPAAIMLSFGDPTPFAERIHDAGARLICQVHTVHQAQEALDAGADVLVAQGGEAGGHGTAARSTFTLVPDIADLITTASPGTPLLAAGGVADGRGLAAALALGADGVLVGTRFWATEEALVSEVAQRRVVRSSGDDTIRTGVYDVVRQYPWPAGYNGRLLRNTFIDRWHGHEHDLRANLSQVHESFQSAVAAEDFDLANVIVGEAIGQINDIRPAADVVHALVTGATDILRHAAGEPSALTA